MLAGYAAFEGGGGDEEVGVYALAEIGGKGEEWRWSGHIGDSCVLS